MTTNPDSILAGPVCQDRHPSPGSILCLGWASGVEWKQAQLPISGLSPDLVGLRLIHITDLHLRRRWCDGYDRLIDRISQARPDLLVFTGDFIDDKRDYRPALPILQRLIRPLRARLGIFGVLGNHDSDMVGVHLVELGVRLIEHRREIIGGGLELIGLPGIERKDLDRNFVTALPPKTPGQARIVLCHYPDLFDAIRPAAPDLFLSGHTHGGQICLPGGWPPLTHSPLPRRYTRGIHHRDGTWFVVNRGLGAGKIPVRLFCPPEVIEIELQSWRADASR